MKKTKYETDFLTSRQEEFENICLLTDVENIENDLVNTSELKQKKDFKNE